MTVGRISARYPLVGACHWAPFRLTAWWVSWSGAASLRALVHGRVHRLFLIDLEVKRLPNSLTLSDLPRRTGGFTLTAAMGGCLVGVAANADRRTRPGPRVCTARGVLPRGMGWGDAKLALSLGSL